MPGQLSIKQFIVNDEEFSELVNNASKEGVLKVSDIWNVQDKKTKSPKPTYQNLLNVQFDWNAIKAQAVSSEDVQKVIEKTERTCIRNHIYESRNITQ
ncbi:hypothetical protein N9381_12630, partial [Paracoccaceae bacterium]|nr:hypothetical protein [Paracoccaceae bacterium]